jgi:hypothetical protein
MERQNATLAVLGILGNSALRLRKDRAPKVGESNVGERAETTPVMFSLLQIQSFAH